MTTHKSLPTPRRDALRYAEGRCALGSFLLAETDAGICALLFGSSSKERRTDLRRRFPRAVLVGEDADFQKRTDRLAQHLRTSLKSKEIPLDLHGTAFQLRVWQTLQKIPAGQTATYSEIAQAIGRPGSARAVAAACAANNIAVLIPCHRVVRKDGNLAGYRWGMDRKQTLLSKEGVDFQRK